jgi:hypothetical protein
LDSAGFNEKTFIDATGAPHTDEMRTTERIRRISPTQLEDVITIHDPEYYTRDWQARFVYTLRNDVRLEDYVCGEPHRDISGVAAFCPLDDLQALSFGARGEPLHDLIEYRGRQKTVGEPVRLIARHRAKIGARPYEPVDFADNNP